MGAPARVCPSASPYEWKGRMTGKIIRSESGKVGLVAAGCMVVIILITTQVLHLQPLLPSLGPLMLFLGYRVSNGWTPVPEVNAGLFWSAAILFTTVVELVFAALP